jgi:hypothetical protein
LHDCHPQVALYQQGQQQPANSFLNTLRTLNTLRNCSRQLMFGAHREPTHFSKAGSNSKALTLPPLLLLLLLLLLGALVAWERAAHM